MKRVFLFLFFAVLLQSVQSQTAGFLGRRHQLRLGLHTFPAYTNPVSVNKPIKNGFMGFHTTFTGAYGLLLGRITRMNAEFMYSETAVREITSSNGDFGLPVVAVGGGIGFDFFLSRALAPVGFFFGLHLGLFGAGPNVGALEYTSSWIDIRMGYSHVFARRLSLDYGISGGTALFPNFTLQGTDKVFLYNPEDYAARIVRQLHFNAFVKVGVLL